MKIYILTDLEGPCLVSRWEQTRASEATPAKLQAMAMLTGEVNAAVDGVLDVDPGAEVVVWDGHGSGGIDILQFHPRAWFISHGGGIRAPYYLDGSFDGLMFVGQHAMAGTPAAPLCHTYSSKTVEFYELNGEPHGEFGCRAIMAGTCGVPTLFCSGDDKACAEAGALVPGIFTVATKLGRGIEQALHRPVETVRKEIRATVVEAVRRRREIAPVRRAGPYTMRSRVLPECSVDGYLSRSPEVMRLDDRTVEWTVDDICQLWI
ncbi:MAG: M55 family metallopeptidase [Armatimonadetes bacterium]|nr:M55 family metallopeptidase [Armatimonadota bacterium]